MRERFVILVNDVEQNIVRSKMYSRKRIGRSFEAPEQCHTVYLRESVRTGATKPGDADIDVGSRAGSERYIRESWRVHNVR